MRAIPAVLLGALSFVAADRAAAEQSSLCVYHNRSYSDGAHICVQRELMMSCSADGGRAVWRIVEDSRLARLCVTPTAGGTARWDWPAAQRPQHRRRTSAVRPDARSSPKCFTFVGRRFCE